MASGEPAGTEVTSPGNLGGEGKETHQETSQSVDKEQSTPLDAGAKPFSPPSQVASLQPSPSGKAYVPTGKYRAKSFEKNRESSNVYGRYTSQVHPGPGFQGFLPVPSSVVPGASSVAWPQIPNAQYPTGPPLPLGPPQIPDVPYPTGVQFTPGPPHIPQFAPGPPQIPNALYPAGAQLPQGPFFGMPSTWQSQYPGRPLTTYKNPSLISSYFPRVPGVVEHLTSKQNGGVDRVQWYRTSSAPIEC
jgi:hypothetical protein